jgi:Na+/glutamate symporter
VELKMSVTDKLHENIETSALLLKIASVGVATALILGGFAAYKIYNHYRHKHKDSEMSQEKAEQYKTYRQEK